VKESIVRFVLQAESNTSRFEDFCNALLSMLEGGLPILSTSRTHDMGRDGRSLGGKSRIYSCSSLNDNVDAKAKSDIARITATTPKMDKVYFCSSQDITEKKSDKLKLTLQKLLPAKTEIELCGLGLIVQLAVRYNDIFERFYRSELDQSLALLSGSNGQAEPENSSLQLALATLGSDSSDLIRAEVYRGSLRLVLAESGRSLNECCRMITELFRLHAPLPPDAILPHIEQLSEKKEIAQDNSIYSLTSQGRDQLEEQKSKSIDNLAQGRKVIREQIEKSLGYTLANSNFDQIWKILQEKLSYLFFLKGQEMVLSISHLLERRNLAEETQNEPLFFIDEIADTIAGTVSGPLADELHVAIKDLFQDPVGPAFDWLSGICGAFVILCSLGIEAESGDVIAKILAKTDIILDTDVCLSLLGEGEMNHEAIESVVKRWRILGGGLWVSKEVLEEVAYHAHIADADFQNVASWLPGTQADRIQLIENAFVRGFAELLASKKARHTQWTHYIEQFRGDQKYDVSTVAALLRDDSGFELLPERSSQEDDLREMARDYLIGIIEGRRRQDDIKNAQDKAQRDASLFASIITFRRDIRRRDSERSCLFVSSARRMAELDKRFAEPGDQSLVVSAATLVHLMSLAPQVSIGLKSMRAFLFEMRKVPFSSNLERVVLRVVRNSKDFHMPWAKRHSLVREVRKRILSNANAAGTNSELLAAELFQNLADRRQIEPLTKILNDSLKAVVVDRNIEIENVELRQKIEELTEEVERLRQPQQLGGPKRVRKRVPGRK
jgi:hypothetical protein